MNPLVSICIPTFNGAKYLKEALNSVALQSYTNIEVIISDDASNDDTLEIVQKFKHSVKFPVFIFNHTPNGIGANWNNCIKKANGEYIKFLFQDDVLAPNCIKEMLRAFNFDSKVQLVGCKRNFIVESDSQSDSIKKWILDYKDLQAEFKSINDEYLILDKSIFRSLNFKRSPLNKVGEPSTVMFKKALVKRIGFFNESLEQILDYEYWYRILKNDSIVVLNKELVSFRVHATQATNINRNKVIKDYFLYDKILYSKYYKLLHKDLKKQLYNKFGLIPQIKRNLKKILKQK